MPPEFYLEQLSDDVYRITYISTRVGLSGFVEGLLKGLGTRFERDVNILAKTKMPTDSGEEWVFEIQIT